MKPEETPEVVDLRRYRAAQQKAAEAKAAQAKAARRAASDQRVLGGRRHAGLILLAVLAVLLALWVVPLFL